MAISQGPPERELELTPTAPDQRPPTSSQSETGVENPTFQGTPIPALSSSSPWYSVLEEPPIMILALSRHMANFSRDDPFMSEPLALRRCGGLCFLQRGSQELPIINHNKPCIPVQMPRGFCVSRPQQSRRGCATCSLLFIAVHPISTMVSDPIGNGNLYTTTSLSVFVPQQLFDHVVNPTLSSSSLTPSPPNPNTTRWPSLSGSSKSSTAWLSYLPSSPRQHAVSLAVSMISTFHRI